MPALILVLALWGAFEAFAFPKKFLHMSFNQSGQKKEIFLIGDRHNLALEQSKEGKMAIKAVDGMVDSLIQTPTIPIIWEHGGKTNPRAQAVFLTTKGEKLFNRFEHFVASDRMRSASWELRRFLVSLNYNKKKAAKELFTKEKRAEILSDLKAHFGYEGTHNHLVTIWKSCPLVLNKTQTLKVASFLDWYQTKVTFCGDALKAWPASKVELSLVIKTLQSVLVYGAADMEILLNALCAKGSKSLVYAGKGHVDRVQKYLGELGFQIEYQLETERFFDKKDYQIFRAKIEAKEPPATFLAETMP